ncbi:hypothetical protein EYF80_037671 [Liparis tanakae]|uniref:Uncharacterized protein n=1 Tax=Liparis tanakae TaxID=230148 RepID=A0A4Z2GHI7_9TELE|nr:hypothetical protein EYF80_037671 [Liparis tanakae]
MGRGGNGALGTVIGQGAEEWCRRRDTGAGTSDGIPGAGVGGGCYGRKTNTGRLAESLAAGAGRQTGSRATGAEVQSPKRGRQRIGGQVRNTYE